MIADKNRIVYSSKNGYTGVISGKSELLVYNDAAGMKEVFRTNRRAIETIGELKTFVDSFPAFMEMLNTTAEPKPMIPQIKEFAKDFEKNHVDPPLYVICNRRTFRDLEIEAGIGYVCGNPCATIYGMLFKVPEDGEIIITNGRVEKYKFEGGGKH